MAASGTAWVCRRAVKRPGPAGSDRIGVMPCDRARATAQLPHQVRPPSARPAARPAQCRHHRPVARPPQGPGWRSALRRRLHGPVCERRLELPTAADRGGRAPNPAGRRRDPPHLRQARRPPREPWCRHQSLGRDGELRGGPRSLQVPHRHRGGRRRSPTGDLPDRGDQRAAQPPHRTPGPGLRTRPLLPLAMRHRRQPRQQLLRSALGAGPALRAGPPHLRQHRGPRDRHLRRRTVLGRRRRGGPDRRHRGRRGAQGRDLCAAARPTGQVRRPDPGRLPPGHRGAAPGLGLQPRRALARARFQRRARAGGHGEHVRHGAAGGPEADAGDARTHLGGGAVSGCSGGCRSVPGDHRTLEAHRPGSSRPPPHRGRAAGEDECLESAHPSRGDRGARRLADGPVRVRRPAGVRGPRHSVPPVAGGRSWVRPWRRRARGEPSSRGPERAAVEHP